MASLRGGLSPVRRRETDLPAAEQSARGGGGVLMGLEPRAGDPKPSDLSRGAGRSGGVKAPVEARRGGSDVQIVPLTLG